MKIKEEEYVQQLSKDFFNLQDLCTCSRKPSTINKSSQEHQCRKAPYG
jgi:hypothetical protein